MDVMQQAMEVFARGFAFTRSFTHPYLPDRVGDLWVVRDGPRKKGDFRREEWIAQGVTPRKVVQAARAKQILPEHLVAEAPLRCYAGLVDGAPVGWVSSVDLDGISWCSNMYFKAEYRRRRGIGRALMAKMLRDDRKYGSQLAVLTASHTGTLLYPRVGYREIGTLLVYTPKKR